MTVRVWPVNISGLLKLKIDLSGAGSFRFNDSLVCLS
jgi:hypothetical protein